jgi:oligoribonuclease NrnB/cAMP/cGMP phosphodiesterase (DHH superfamily)
MTKTICFHHNDEDGRASGAIVRYALHKNVELFETDYDGKPIPWGELDKYDQIVIVDFSFPLEDMQKMANGRTFTWIDHHKSALTEMEEISRNWDGLRDISEAACVLTWRYFFPNVKTPRAITLIGDRDIWRWAEKDTGAFTEGIHAQDTRAENDALWVPLLEDDPELMNEIISEGKRLREIRLASINILVERLGFEVLFEGHRTLAINVNGNGDYGQRGRDLGYEIVYCYQDQMQNGELFTSVTMFSKKADVSLIARKYGGGGHENAAGFSFSRGSSPFPPKADVKWLSKDLL